MASPRFPNAVPTYLCGFLAVGVTLSLFFQLCFIFLQRGFRMVLLVAGGVVSQAQSPSAGPAALGLRSLDCAGACGPLLSVSSESGNAFLGSC